MNKQDSQFARIINDRTILIDFRGMRCRSPMQAGMARALADRHFKGEYKNNDDGFDRILDGCDYLNVYHVESVANKIWVVSLDKLTSDQTRPIAEQYVVANPKKK